MNIVCRIMRSMAIHDLTLCGNIVLAEKLVTVYKDDIEQRFSNELLRDSVTKII